MFSGYQLKIAYLYNITNDNVKKLMPNFIDKEKYVIHYENVKLYLRLGLKLKNYIAYQNLTNQFNQRLKQYVEFNTQKGIEAGKNSDKNRKAL